MKLFKVFFTLFVIVLGLFIVSRFFPHTYYVERTVKINKPVADVYAFMEDFKNWEKWSLWNKETDPTLHYFYGKHSNGIEARQYFYGEKLGIGRFKFDTCDNQNMLVYDLYMHAGEINASGKFQFVSEGSATELKWIDQGDVGGNPIYRFMLSSKITSTEQTFDDGLARIKKVIEAN